MRSFGFVFVLLLAASSIVLAQSEPSAPVCCTLTIVVEGMNSADGNLGVLVFNNSKGWPEDRFAALKDIAIPAVKGTQVLKVPGLAPGRYAVALIHDANKNHKLDKNFLGYPKEQWGLSNNPHATLKAPGIEKAMFALDHDLEIHISLQ